MNQKSIEHIALYSLVLVGTLVVGVLARQFVLSKGVDDFSSSVAFFATVIVLMAIYASLQTTFNQFLLSRIETFLLRFSAFQTMKNHNDTVSVPEVPTSKDSNQTTSDIIESAPTAEETISKPSEYEVLRTNSIAKKNRAIQTKLEKVISYTKQTMVAYILSLIKELISHNSANYILDFFSGSGTTLHATMQLNAEDGGNRQCILITNNENNICENITYKRNQLVINGYTDLNNEEVPGLTKNNLRYYRTGFVGRSRSMQNMRKLVNLATDMLCIKENLYTEQNTFGGQKTYKNVFRYFDDGKKQMLIIYREEAIDELVDIIYDMNIPQPIKVYVFSPSEDPWEGSFDDVSDKVELCALPQAIYNTYRRILPKKKDAVVMPEEDALASTQEDKDLFDGMLNFEYDEEA